MVQPGELGSVRWPPGWEGSSGENGHVYVYAESQTITVLLIGHTPTQNRKFRKRNRQ